MLFLKLIQLAVGAIFTYLGFEMRFRHNYRLLRGFVMKRSYSGLSRGYARRAGRIFLFGGLINLVLAILMLIFVWAEDGAAIGMPHYMVAISFTVGMVGMLIAILCNELYNLRRHGDR